MNQQRRGEASHEAGFTLVEVLVAALLFAVGMVALVAMQYTALGGYSNNRDLTQASQVGQRVIDIMRTEAQQWKSGMTLSTAVSNGNIVFPYTGSSPNAMGNATVSSSGALLGLANSWTWEPVFTDPVDTRLTTTGAQKFCVYLRGGTFNGLPGSEGMKLRAQVAVVWGNGVAGGACPESSSTLTNNLKLGGDSVIDAETLGYRVVMLGTVIRQRMHLG